MKRLFTFSQEDGTYSISAPQGEYRVFAYHPRYGELGSTDTLTLGS